MNRNEAGRRGGVASAASKKSKRATQNPNPSGQSTTEASDRPEASGPVGLGPDDVREIFSRRLNLHYDQRAYSWHEIQDALEEVDALAKKRAENEEGTAHG